jgi:hypothetical protein
LCKHKGFPAFDTGIIKRQFISTFLSLNKTTDYCFDFATGMGEEGFPMLFFFGLAGAFE